MLLSVHEVKGWRQAKLPCVRAHARTYLHACMHMLSAAGRAWRPPSCVVVDLRGATALNAPQQGRCVDAELQSLCVGRVTPRKGRSGTSIRLVPVGRADSNRKFPVCGSK